MTVTPGEPKKTVNSGTMTSLVGENIIKLQKNKEKLSKNLQNKINNLATRNASNQEIKQVIAERNSALKGLATYEETLAEVMKTKQANAKIIQNLETKFKALQGISKATQIKLSEQIKALKRNRNTALALVKQLENNKTKLSTLVNNLKSQINNSKISNAALKTKLTTILSQRNSIQQKLNKAIENGALTQEEINNLRESTRKERESLLAQVRNAQEIVERLKLEKKEKTLRNAALVALQNKLKTIVSIENISSYEINNKYKNNDNFKRAVTNRKSTLESIKKASEERRRQAAEEAAARAAAAAEARKTALSSFKAKVTKAIVTMKDAEPELKQLLLNANKPNSNLPSLEIRFADIADKPRIYLFLNQFDGKNIPPYAQLGSIQTFAAGNNNVTNAVTTMNDIVNDYTSIKNKKKLNLFFIGPSGSGKTFLFNKYLGKKITKVTAYYPTFDYNLKSGTLTISDTSKEMYYSEFKERFIRPTPFNPESSRAHMSYQNGDVTAFDLAGTENPMAIMYKSLGYNIFETQYWEKFSSASVASHASKRGPLGEEVKDLLLALKLPKTGVGLSGLDEMVFLYVYWNYIHKEAGWLTKINGIINPIKKIIIRKSDATKIKMMVDVFNDIKRVFEGFWITRSLHALNLLFTKNSYKNLVSKTTTTLIGSNIARSNITKSNGGFEIQIKELVNDKYKTSNFVEQLGGISNNQSANFIILNKTEPSYETNFVAGLKKSGNSNCLFGVVNDKSIFKVQRKAAINYLKSLQE